MQAVYHPNDFEAAFLRWNNYKTLLLVNSHCVLKLKWLHKPPCLHHRRTHTLSQSTCRNARRGRPPATVLWEYTAAPTVFWSSMLNIALFLAFMGILWLVITNIVGGRGNFHFSYFWSVGLNGLRRCNIASSLMSSHFQAGLENVNATVKPEMKI